MYNPYLVIPFAIWIIAQTLKFSLEAFRGKVDFRNFYASGGMPSAHSAVVVSLAMTTLILDGPNSALFGITAIVAAIVMYDSFGVRRSSGEQAAAINMVLESLSSHRMHVKDPGLKLREILGHKPHEVIAGAVLGFFFGSIFNWQQIQPQIAFLVARPPRFELMAYAILFGILIVGGLATKIFMSLRFKQSPTMQEASRKILTKTQTIGWLGMVAVFGAYENVAYISWRMWHWLIIIALIVWDVILLPKLFKLIPEGLAAEAEKKRKFKWLSMPSGRNRTKKKK